VTREQPGTFLCVDGGARYAGSSISPEGDIIVCIKDKLADYCLDMILEKLRIRPSGWPGIAICCHRCGLYGCELGGLMRVAHFGYAKENSYGNELMRYSTLNKFL